MSAKQRKEREQNAPQTNAVPIAGNIVGEQKMDLQVAQKEYHETMDRVRDYSKTGAQRRLMESGVKYTNMGDAWGTVQKLFDEVGRDPLRIKFEVFHDNAWNSSDCTIKFWLFRA